ncbi:MAG TPA: AAA family ATPase, partial [Kofleriaceae bacterium]|nr:AAA family ATPase [Kofleriaceae bacterium]
MPRGQADDPLAFAGTDRFVVDGCLGKGGMGVVYRAFDRERSIAIALKTVLRRDATSLYQFKQEFRALADVVHPNLASLYELHAVGDQWFFTMELVDGTDFLSYVRGQPARRTAARAAGGTDTTRTITLGDAVHEGGDDEVAAPVDYRRLREALRQLVAGVRALHDSGHLHRDIKPSNVLVAADGRVVLLDFGVITELSGRDADAGVIMGTPAYMAPELLAPGARSSQASDWYSVGVILYQAITGRRPHAGTGTDILGRQARVIPPSARARDVPADLEQLCVELLHADPAQRPHGDAIIRRLAPAEAPGLPAAAAEDLFVGRVAQLEQLRRAQRSAQAGPGRVVYLHGPSGIGKSALVQQFLREVGADARAVVLAGRCYQRESVPFKAVDSLIDSLSRFLVALPADDIEPLLPPDIHLLARVFPVLRRVDAIARIRRGAGVPDPHELRRRAFAALRALLARLGARRPLLLFIDDLQWGDADSVPILDGLMRPPDAPSLLLIASYRTADAAGSPLLQALFRRHARLGPAANVEQIALDTLPPESAGELAARMLAGSGCATETAGQLAEAAAGNPFFLHELVRAFAAQPAGGAQPSRAPDLEQVIMARVAELPPAARRLLELTAVAAGPTPLGVVRAASRMDEAQRPEPIKALAAAHLVRLGGARDDDVIETFHDRIRETVAAHLRPDQLREHHLHLALALEASAGADAETLCEHFHRAGRDDVAAEYAIAAADHAAAALAFGRAATLYERARDLAGPEAPGQRAIDVKLADALANAGRSAEAAQLYLSLVAGAAPGEALTLKRLAADHYLRAGMIDEGVTTLDAVLATVGYRLARTPNRALASLLWRRLLLRLRGFGFRSRDAAALPERDLTRIDACWIAAEGLGLVDTIHGMDFQSRGMLCALRAGEPYRVARALVLESGYASISGARGNRRALRLMARAGAMVDALGRPELHAFTHAITSFIHYQRGAFAESL